MYSVEEKENIINVSLLLFFNQTHPPGLAEVEAPLYQHRRRSESPEGDHHVGEVELRLQVQLDRYVLLAVLALPPRPFGRSAKVQRF